MNWLRIIVFATLLLGITNFIGFASGMAMVYFDFYGTTPENAIANTRLIRQIFIGIIATLVYWQFCNGVTKHKFLQALAVFIAIQILDVISSVIIFNVTLQDLYQPSILVRGFIALLLGYGLSLLTKQHTKTLNESSEL